MTSSSTPIPEKKRRPARRRQISRRRLWTYRLVALIVIPAAIFSLLEIGLRIGGYGHDTSFTRQAEIDGRTHIIDNRTFAYPFFGPRLARTAVPFALMPEKPDGTVRVFVLGGSAARGFPQPAYSMSRHLEVMLDAAYPGRRFEVVNTAMTAINSHVVVSIAEACADLQPDLFVVYLGNNEAVGPYGPATVFAPLTDSRAAIRAGQFVSSSRTGQLLTAVLGPLRESDDRPGAWRGMEMFLDNQVSASDPRLETMYEHFRANLNDICDAAAGAGVPLILCTVGVNVRDCPPLASQHRADLAQADLGRWDDLYARGAAAQAAGKWDEAIRLLTMAEDIDDQHAELAYRLAQCRARAGDWKRAGESYRRAVDLDTLRFRADSRINAILREVAAERRDAGVTLVDAAAALAARSDHGLCGDERFYEHVHLRFEGNCAVSQAIFSAAVEVLGLPAGGASPAAAPDIETVRRRLAFSQLERYDLMEMMLSVQDAPPFTGQLGHAQRLAAIRTELADLRKRLDGPARDKALDLHAQAAAQPDAHWMVHDRHAYVQLKYGNNAPEAAKHWRIVIKRLPHASATYGYLGILAAWDGRSDQALTYLRTAVELDPYSAETHVNLANAQAAAGRHDRADASYARALELDPRQVKAWVGRAKLALTLGREDQAAGCFVTALELAPNDADVHQALGRLMIAQGKAPRGLTHLERALQIEPQRIGVAADLADYYCQHGHPERAAKHLDALAAARLQDPAMVVRIATVLSSQGRTAEAIAQLRRAALATPEHPGVLNALAWQLATAPEASLRDGALAVKLAEKANRLVGGRSADMLDTLGAAYAADGQFGRAVTVAGRAARLADAGGRDETAAVIREHIKRYRSNKPLFDPP